MAAWRISVLGNRSAACLKPQRSRRRGRPDMLGGELWLRTGCGVGRSALRAAGVLDGSPKTRRQITVKNLKIHFHFSAFCAF